MSTFAGFVALVRGFAFVRFLHSFFDMTVTADAIILRSLQTFGSSVVSLRHVLLLVALDETNDGIDSP
jgi:hypothetical protein